AGGGLHAIDAEHVLDRDRDPRQQGGLSRGQAAVGFGGLLAGQVRRETEKRPHLAVDRVDAVQVRLQDLLGAHLAVREQVVELGDRQPEELAHPGSASWIAFTAKNPSRASGALASTSSCVRQGPGRSSRMRSSTSTTW